MSEIKELAAEHTDTISPRSSDSEKLSHQDINLNSNRDGKYVHHLPMIVSSMFRGLEC